jgi:FkbM family methyltransferase
MGKHDTDLHTPEANLVCAGVLIPDDESVITPAIREAILAGRFEAEEAHELPGIVVPGDRVLEIGAGIGFISTLLSRQPEVEKVIAVEANPFLLGYMEQLHKANGVTKAERRNVVLTNSADAEMTFYIRHDFWMGSLSAGPNPFTESVQVPTSCLDGLLRAEAISLIVCDIEGAEAFVFDGADLTGVDRVYLELHDHVTGLSGVQNLFNTMCGHGFSFDPRHSSRSIVLFRRVQENEILRPYSG